MQMIQMMMGLLLLASTTAQVDYNSEIQPILDDRCTMCHGNYAGLDISSYANIMAGSNNGDVVNPYDHTASELWIRVNSGQMPPGNNDLTIAQINLIAQWIDEGALPEDPDCDPDLLCGGAITCCDGLLYPSTCCNENCDEPIGECGDTLVGDLNDDGILNVLDVVLMVNMVL